MRSEGEISIILQRMNKAQLFMPGIYFSDAELVVVHRLIAQATSGDGPYRMEDGRFVVAGVVAAPPEAPKGPAAVRGGSEASMPPGSRGGGMQAYVESAVVPRSEQLEL